MKKLLAVLLALSLLSGCAASQPEKEEPDTACEEVTTRESTAADTRPPLDVTVWEGKLAELEIRAEEIKTRLGEEPLTQQEMNEEAQALLEIWDGALNELWAELENTLPAEEFQLLRQDQRSWLQIRDAAVAEAGRSVEGGSMYNLVTAMEAAEQTRLRMYALLQMLHGD